MCLSLSLSLPGCRSWHQLPLFPDGLPSAIDERSLAHWPGNLGDEDEENDGGGGGRGSISQHLKTPSETICASSTIRRPSQENGHGQRERERERERENSHGRTQLTRFAWEAAWQFRNIYLQTLRARGPIVRNVAHRRRRLYLPPPPAPVKAEELPTHLHNMAIWSRHCVSHSDWME